MTADLNRFYVAAGVDPYEEGIVFLQCDRDGCSWEVPAPDTLATMAAAAEEHEQTAHEAVPEARDDLEALLTSWEVPFRNHTRDDGGTDVVFGNDYDDPLLRREVPTVTGYTGFYVRAEFDADGRFVRIGAWE